MYGSQCWYLWLSVKTVSCLTNRITLDYNSFTSWVLANSMYQNTQWTCTGFQATSQETTGRHCSHSLPNDLLCCCAPFFDFTRRWHVTGCLDNDSIKAQNVQWSLQMNSQPTFLFTFQDLPPSVYACRYTKGIGSSTKNTPLQTHLLFQLPCFLL